MSEGTALTVAQMDVTAGEMEGSSEAAIQLFRERLPGLGVYPRSGESEVDKVESPAFPFRLGSEHEVARLDVAVNDTLIVDMFNDVQLPW